MLFHQGSMNIQASTRCHRHASRTSWNKQAKIVTQIFIQSGQTRSKAFLGNWRNYQYLGLNALWKKWVSERIMSSSEVGGLVGSATALKCSSKFFCRASVSQSHPPNGCASSSHSPNCSKSFFCAALNCASSTQKLSSCSLNFSSKSIFAKSYNC